MMSLCMLLGEACTMSLLYPVLISFSITTMLHKATFFKLLHSIIVVSKTSTSFSKYWSSMPLIIIYFVIFFFLKQVTNYVLWGHFTTFIAWDCHWQLLFITWVIKIVDQYYSYSHTRLKLLTLCNHLAIMQNGVAIVQWFRNFHSSSINLCFT